MSVCYLDIMFSVVQFKAENNTEQRHSQRNSISFLSVSSFHRRFVHSRLTSWWGFLFRQFMAESFGSFVWQDAMDSKSCDGRPRHVVVELVCGTRQAVE